jgi:two-component system chemotaxis response regulator CheY
MKKVLIVDDAGFMRLSMKIMLENNGFEVVGEAQNGVEAVTKYKKHIPDITTMDITMPEMSGIEALKAIKEFDSNAKVVMVSAVGEDELVREAIMFGAKSFIVKPFLEAKLIKTLNKIYEI